MTRREKDSTICVKLVIFVLGIVILILGLHSFVNSAWTNRTGSAVIFQTEDKLVNFGHDVCDISRDLLVKAGKDCPPISLEHYFVAVIIITFVVSIIGLVWDFGRMINISYHGMASILLLIAGIVYIVSAVQIDDLVKWAECKRTNTPTSLHVIDLHVDYLKSEKLVAGMLTMVHALLYGVVTILQLNRSSDGDGRRRLWMPSAYVEINESNSNSHALYQVA